MDYARLGNTGLKVSRICLGCMSYGDPDRRRPTARRRWPWALREDEARPFFKRAIELGINFFDTANVYSAGASEEITGRALKALARREDLVIATKVHGAMSAGPERPGSLAQGDPPRDRREPAPPRDRLRRPLPDSPLGRRHADRGDAGGARTTSCARARRATSAPRRCSPGSSARRCTSPSGTAGRASSRCRTTTTCSTARKSAR